MSRELSDDARHLIRTALAEERTPDGAHRAQLRRKVLARAAAGTVASLVGTSVAKASASSVLSMVASGVGLGFGVGLVLVGAAHFAFEPSAPVGNALSASAPSARSAPARNVESPAPSATATVLSPPVSAEPSAGDRDSAPPAPARSPLGTRAATSVASLPSSRVENGPLRAELDLMARVQGALRDGDGVSALELIALYDARHPGGVLETERLAAEVFAACQIGDRGRARRAAPRFLARDSASALAARVKSSCASDQ